ncbi:hypothetical protein ACJIZ3_012602 [Penstemon smallii]|uniref:Uncharacterized protein n=1 Tax=Penstemon smallii TaxID=265156 RepID=A0ABD3UR21_9LAMI
MSETAPLIILTASPNFTIAATASDFTADNDSCEKIDSISGHSSEIASYRSNARNIFSGDRIFLLFAKLWGKLNNLTPASFEISVKHDSAIISEEEKTAVLIAILTACSQKQSYNQQYSVNPLKLYPNLEPVIELVNEEVLILNSSHPLRKHHHHKSRICWFVWRSGRTGPRPIQSRGSSDLLIE